MGFERVFKDARDGQLYRLKEFLDNKSKNEVEFLVSANTNGATPLIIACVNGHLDVALYLIENCQADVEQGGSVTVGNEVIKDASPLWYAAYTGHLNLVNVLVKFQASVNSTTKTNSTPLQAACCGGHFEIVKYLIEHGADFEIANRMGNTCLMIACYKDHYDIAKYLIERGAYINRKNSKGSTALHECAVSGSLSIARLLLLNGAEFDCDIHHKTPLWKASNKGHGCIVEYFIQNIECTKEEKVNALELLGAILIIKEQGYHMALNYWKTAMDLRHEDFICLLEKPTTRSSFGSYIDTDEVHTFAQIEHLITDRARMRIQALLVIERILGPYHSETIYYIRCEGKAYADNGNIGMCIKYWMYILDVQQKISFRNSQEILLSCVELLCNSRGYYVTFQNIFNIFKRVLKQINNVITGIRDLHRLLVIALHLLRLMCKLQSNNSENLKLKEVAYKLIHMNLTDQNGFTPLHLACRKNSVLLDIHKLLFIPSFDLVDLLLEVGACPNAVDIDNNTPLHISAVNEPCAEAIFKSLLKHGAHLDLCNNKRQTPLLLIQDNYLLDICPLRYTNLQCLSAHAVRTHNIPYKGYVPKIIETFLDGH